MMLGGRLAEHLKWLLPNGCITICLGLLRPRQITWMLLSHVSRPHSDSIRLSLKFTMLWETSRCGVEILAVRLVASKRPSPSGLRRLPIAEISNLRGPDHRRVEGGFRRLLSSGAFSATSSWPERRLSRVVPTPLICRLSVIKPDLLKTSRSNETNLAPDSIVSMAILGGFATAVLGLRGLVRCREAPGA